MAEVALMSELGLGLDLSNLVSTGGIATALFARGRAARMTHADAVAGAVASAFYGGWSAARVLHVPCPAVLVDLSGAYAWGYASEGLQRFVIADRVDARDSTDEVRLLGSDKTLRERLFVGEVPLSRRLVLVQLRPTGSEILPTKSLRDGTARLSFARTDFQGHTGWWWLSDVLAGVAFGGEYPKRIVEAIEFVPVGVRESLRPVRLPTGRMVDLSREDLALAIRQERDRVSADLTLPRWRRARDSQLLRLLASTLTFGNPARIDRATLRRPIAETVIGPGGERIDIRTVHPEQPGPYFDFRIAGAVTSRIRLVMASVIRACEVAGGSWLHAATDSLLLAATHADQPQFVACPGGGFRRGRTAGVRALPLSQIRQILADSGAPWSEKVGFDRPAIGYVSGLHRVGLVDRDGRLVLATEAALGGVDGDPTATGERTADGHFRWAVEGHEAVVRSGLAWGGRGPLPDLVLPGWSNLPAVRPGLVSTAEQMARLQRVFPDVRIRPFAPYLQAVVDPMESVGVVPVCLDCDLVPSEWLRADWRDQRTGHRLTLTTDLEPPTGAVRVRTYREVLELWRLPDDPTTAPVEVVDHVLQPGLRVPVPVRSRASLFEFVGKEGDDLLSPDARPRCDQERRTHDLPPGRYLGTALGEGEDARGHRTRCSYSALRAHRPVCHRGSPAVASDGGLGRGRSVGYRGNPAPSLWPCGL